MTIPSKEYNAEKGVMDETNSPEWKEYFKRLEQHEKFCDDYRFFLDRITRHLEWLNPSNTWTTDEIRKVIGGEIVRSTSMDGPNRPGYIRANND